MRRRRSLRVRSAYDQKTQPTRRVKNSALSFAFIRSPTGTPTIYLLSFLSLLSFRFSFGVRLAFFCCSFFPLSFFPVSPITCSPCHLDIRLPIAIALNRNFPIRMPIVAHSFHKYISEGRIRPSKRVPGGIRTPDLLVRSHFRNLF